MDLSSAKFQAAQVKAQKILQEQEKLNELLQAAVEKARRNKQRLEEIWQELQLLIQMVRAYFRKEYRTVPWKVILAAVAALVYFVNPFDIVPDFLPGVGFLDDATIITLVINSIREEMERFKQFLQSTPQNI